ncbi:MAG: YbjN domain-containing protein [Terracidiphilus sp.]|jgi:hypothetical protein
MAQPAAVASAATAVPQPPAPAPPPPTAPMHSIPDGGLTLEDIVAWLRGGGYSAKVVTGENGKRHILSNTQGVPFDIFTPGCTAGRCSSLSIVIAFSTSGKFDVSQLNEWNSDVPWCKAYHDSVNDPCLDMDISLWPGGTYESLNDLFATWNSVLGKFIAKYSLR